LIAAAKRFIRGTAGTGAEKLRTALGNGIHFARFSPKSVDFIEALPHNAPGKILRRHLRDPY
jgi:acyl-coenzyme A synthetase/AMP-(fatty) acid ligase